MAISLPRTNHRIRIAPAAIGGQIADISAGAGVSSVTSHLLTLRGVRTPADALEFLSPRLDTIADPLLLPDAAPAIDRICYAINNKETIFVHGDYDVDGVTSAALYTRVLGRLGAHIIPFVPHRGRDGFGVRPANVDAAHAAGARLLLTGDCGASAHDACLRARELGLDMIVTDHHECPPDLPCAFAVVDPMRPDSRYPFPHLAGVGVAYKICQGVCSRMGVDIGRLHDHFLDLVALGTVADVAPLLGENRAYVYYGLDCIAATKKPGLRALVDASDVGDKITARTIGWQLGPRINAAGRIAESSLALELMLTSDTSRARAIAADICRHNDDRRRIQDEVFTQALAQVEQSDPDAPVIVVGGQGWNTGIVGVVAGRICDLFFKPTFVLGIDSTGTWRGSGRSIPGFNLAQAIETLGPDLVKGGGHAMAAGVSFPADNLQSIRGEFGRLALEWLSEEDRTPCLDVEAVLDVADITPDLVEEISRLAPFGEANPEPVFLSDEVKLTDIRLIGAEGAHFRASVTGANRAVAVVGWGMGPWAQEASETVAYRICYNLRINEYNGARGVDLVLVSQPLSDGN